MIKLIMFYSITIILAISLLLWPVLVFINPEMAKGWCMVGVLACLTAFICSLVATSLAATELSESDDDWDDNGY